MAGCSSHPLSRSPSSIVPHKIEGLFVGNGNTIYTKNLVSGEALYDEALIPVKNDDGTEVEYREWNPARSNLAVAIICGAENLWIKPGSRVLYIGDANGTTVSHISDIVGHEGMVYAVGNSNCETLAKMAEKRLNIVPIVGQPIPARYRMLVGMVDVMFAVVDSVDQARNVSINAKYYLKANGHYVIYAKANCFKPTSGGEDVFTGLGKEIQIQFKPMEKVALEPFDRDHAYVIGNFRMLKTSVQNCLKRKRDAKYLTAQKYQRPYTERISLHERNKTLPAYMLFETSSGYALLQAHGMYQIGDDYEEIEEYNNCTDENFELLAFHPFESDDEALIYLNKISQEMVPEQLFDFLLHNLPNPKKDGKTCYSLTLPHGTMVNPIVRRTRISCSRDQEYNEVQRGLRMHIDKIIKDVKPGGLEKAQLNLARIHCKQRCSAQKTKGTGA